MDQKQDKSKENWKEKLTEEQYNVCFLKGTEPPGSGKYNKFYEKGTYKCVVCDENLFSSETKYDSGSGWPAFFQPIDENRLTLKPDNSHGLKRIEVSCKKCDAHLGHLFKGVSTPTGKWFCLNSVSLNFEPKK